MKIQDFSHFGEKRYFVHNGLQWILDIPEFGAYVHIPICMLHGIFENVVKTTSTAATVFLGHATQSLEKRKVILDLFNILNINNNYD